jgi:hypothetical protein
VLLIARAAAAEEQADFATGLDKLIRAGRERFRPVKTYRVDIRPGPLYWYESSVMLPGVEYCRIYEHPRRECVCQWPRKAETYAAVVDRVRESLGDRWKSSNSGKMTSFVLLLDDRRTPSVEIVEGSAKSNYSVQLSVVAPPLQ